MRYTKEDAVESSKKTAERLSCPICYFVVEDLTMCSACQQIFYADCIKQCSNQKCPMCKERFKSSIQIRFQTEMLHSVKLNCKTCEIIFDYEQREHHLHDTKVIRCPFECGNMQPCLPDQLDKHVATQCTSSTLKCKECGINIYKSYARETPSNPSGQHSCIRDLKSIIASKDNKIGN